MNSSQKIENNLVLSIYKDVRTVFRLIDIAMLIGESDFISLNKKLNYYVRTRKLQNPRKGIYAKPDYSREELACNIYSPAYISLEYVLQQSGIIFQYDSSITTVSYLSRTIRVEDQTYTFRKIKGDVLMNLAGIKREENHVNIASPERAFLDLLYLTANCYFDNLNPLNKQLVFKLLPMYQSKALTERVIKLLKYDGH